MLCIAVVFMTHGFKIIIVKTKNLNKLPTFFTSSQYFK